MDYTLDRIEKMDLIFEHIISGEPFDKSIFSKLFGIDKELAKELINSVLKIGHEELGILKAQEFPYSKQWYLRDINPIECEEFKNKGGFKQYFCMIENDRKLLDKKSRLELIKIKTDVIKNIGSITAFIASVIFNVLYVSGILTFHIFQPDQKLQEVKYQIHQIEKDKKAQLQNHGKTQSDIMLINLQKQEK